MITYNAFNLKFGNRFPSKLTTPRIFKLDQLVLPKQTCYHYIPSVSSDVGPNASNPLFKPVKARIPMYSYMDIASHLGTMARRSYNQLTEVRKYIRTNRKFRMVMDLDKGYTPQPIIPLVMNYSLVDKRYKYLGNTNRIEYYRGMNILNTVIKGMVDVYNSKGDYHNQFLFLNVPKNITPISVMKRASSSDFTLEHYKTFNTGDKIVIFELWKWIGLRREASIFKNIPQKLLDKINIVIVYNNVFTLFNLGTLNNWRQSEENPKGNVNPLLMGKLFIRLLINLQMANRDSSLVELTEEEQMKLAGETADVVIEDGESAEDVKEEMRDGHPEDDKLSEEATADSPETEDSVSEPEDTLQSDIPSDEEVEELLKIDDIDIDFDTDIVGSVIDEDDEVIEETKLVAANRANQISKVLAEKANGLIEQEPEFEDITDTKFDTVDVLGIKDIPIEEQYNLVERPKEVKSPSEKCRAVLNEVAKDENMTVSKYESLKKSLNKYKELKLSKEDTKTVAEIIDIKPEDIVITEEDKRKASTINVMTGKYVKEIMPRDAVAMLTAVQSNGVIVSNISKTTVEDISGSYEAYSMKIKPIVGEASTVRVKLPKINEDGTFKIGNSLYSQSFQRRDIVIRKIDADTVALTSYFGKTFVRRDSYRIANYEKWLIQEIRKANLNENKTVLETRSGNVFDNLLKAPNVFSLLSMHFRAITTKECFIYLDYHKAKERFGEEAVRKVEGKHLFFCGVYKKNYPLGIDHDDKFYYLDSGSLMPLGIIEDICGLNIVKAPVESITVDIMGKAVPIAIVLGYKFGLTKLLTHLKPKHYRTQPINTRPKLESHEYAIAFNDFYLILSREDKETSLILGSLLKIEETNNVSIYSLNNKDTYFNLLESIKIPGRYLKEIDLYYNMFVDPISERILIEMGEPTDFGGLLFRAVEMLKNRYHKDETDITEQRIVGYERMTGEIYTQLVRAMREHNRHGIKANYPIELNPEAVWLSILKDTSKRMKEDLNPIQDLRSTEEVTFVGNGGRSKKAMVKRTRAHHPTSIGVISEASKDSSDAGVTTYLSGNPKFKNLYGMTENSTTDELIKDIKPDNVLSTAMLISPASDTDDAKRSLLAAVQWAQTFSAENYKVLPTRTGYDSKLVERSSDRYCATAEQDGIVTEINKFAITVKYKDGTTKQVELGRRFGTSGGFATPHDMVTNLKEGSKVKAGDIIAYHSGYFTKDPMNPNSLALRYGALAKVALMENADTFEDSTAISQSFSNQTKVVSSAFKDVVVSFNQNVHKILKPGTEVNIGDALCIIEDSITADTGMFDEESIDLLKNLSNSSPKSAYRGVIDRIEVFYNGDKEDMSETLRKIANITDNILYNKEKALGNKGMTGEVTDDFRVEGKPLLIDTAVIRFTITTEHNISIGDKL